jgi:hypothetical protein
MRVVDERKWKRAKLAVLLANTVAVLWCMGGLEGTEPMPYPTATVLLLVTLGYLTHNLTKHWKH